ncbi:hypothetical protein LLH00_12385 [bacterium]|nr:hypothetical protein [bacterium]
MKKRIVLIGAGSTLFTRGILGSLVTDREFEACTLVLMDVDPERLGLMERYARRLVADTGSGLGLESSLELGRALEGADFVICTVAAQDSRARALEVEIPLRFGYHHSWGDTTGPSGVFRALRHIPIFTGIALEIEKRCPGAWLLNLSNPVAAILRSIRRVSATRTLGFCDAPPYFRRWIEKELFGLSEGSLEAVMAGVDHAVWVLGLRADGRDCLPELWDRIEILRRRMPVNAAILEAYGYLAIPGNEHLCEFFPFFLRDSRSMAQYGLKDMDIPWHRQRRDSLLQKIRREIQGSAPLAPDPLPPEEEVLSIISSIVNDQPRRYVANLPNRNVIANLPGYAVVEAPVLIGAEVTQLPPLTLPPQLTPVLHQSVAKDELVVEAALGGDREKVFQAVLSCPLTESIEQARAITKAMLEALDDLLPETLRTVKNKSVLV